MKNLYERCIKIYDDYRFYIPSFSTAALSFYLMVLIVPITSLIAVISSFLHLDLSLIEGLLSQYIQQSYASMIIDVLESKSVSTISFFILIFSFYAVSRGIGNIYEISKNMYNQKDEESIISYYVYVFKITFFLVLGIVGIIASLVVGPISLIFSSLYEIATLRVVLLYLLLVLCLFCIYMIVPRIHIQMKDGFSGAFVAAGLYLVLYYGLAIYFQYADFQSVYGPLASIIVILFVFDWASEIFYIGMYITHLHYIRRKSDENGNNNNQEIRN